MFEHILYEEIKDRIGLLKINREKALNALNLQTVSELNKFINEQLPGEDLRVLIITGAVCYHGKLDYWQCRCIGCDDTVFF